MGKSIRLSLIVVLFISGSTFATTYNYSDGGVHTISSNFGSSTSDTINIYNTTTLNITSGTIYPKIVPWGNSLLHIAGSITGGLNFMAYISPQENSHVDISGGQFLDAIMLWDNSSVSISGGKFTHAINASKSGHVSISAASQLTSLGANGNASVVIEGRNFSINSQPVSPGADGSYSISGISGTVAGWFRNGTFFSSQITITSPSLLTLVSPVASLLNPNGEELIMAGSSYTINWSNNFPIETILIEYSTDNGGIWMPVSPPNIGNTGSYNWLVPNISSEECLIRISDGADPSVTDTSDGIFSVYIPTLTLLNPNGGEVVLNGNPYEISWSSNYSAGNIFIEYSTNNGQHWIAVDPPNVGNTGSYSWSVPKTISEECLMRITDSANTNINDTSNNVFEIGGCSLAGDLNGDCHVDFFDYSILAENWLKSGSVKIYNFTLSNDPNWSREGEWQFGQPAGGGGSNGNPDPNRGYTGNNVYGVNLNGDYTIAVGGPYHLTAGPFDCSQYINVTLKFYRWLNSDAPSYVSNKVEVSNNGTDWNIVWESNGSLAIADDSWQILEYDISSIADNQPTVYIRWSYEVLDDRAYRYSGWNIDDVQLWGTR